MLNLSTSMIEHLMQLFNLKPNVNSNLNDCMKIIIKPILLFDVSMEIYSNFPEKQLLSDEQKHFNTIKNWLRRFEHDLFAGMTFDEKLILSDAMSEFVDYIQNDINALEDSFNTFLGDKYDNEYKSLLTQLYLISTLSQCVVLYLKDITNEITQQLSMNNSVGIHGFGKFVVRAYCERKCYNSLLIFEFISCMI
jgi:hypothetical protein